MKKYIFATDVDGTMLMDDGTVHPETLQAFKRAKEEGHIVVIATGRCIARTPYLIKKMPYVNYFVCCNGAAVYDVDNESVFILYGIEPKYYLNIREFAKKHNVPYKLHTEKSWIGSRENDVEQPTKLTEELDNKIANHIIENPTSKTIYNGETITQLSIFSTADFCKKYYPELQKIFGKDCEVYLTNSVYIDVNPKNRSKWEGLKDLARKLNIPLENIVTFGDSGNDYEMIHGAGKNGYALANSHKDLVEKIAPRIGSNNTNAIGAKIIEYLENKIL